MAGMTPKLLKKEDIAERFGCGWRKARSLLAKQGVFPIDIGQGQYSRLRWLESSVNAAILAMNEEAQPRGRKSRVRATPASLASMRTSDLYALLVKGQPVQ